VIWSNLDITCISLLVGEKYFIEELKIKFKLETTNAYQKFIDIRNNKRDDIPISFYSIPAFKSNLWKSSNCADRNMFTRHAIHGFHHLICTTIKDSMTVIKNIFVQFVI
jgi:hypothetical protein